MNALLIILASIVPSPMTDIQHVIHANVENKIYVDATIDGENFSMPIINGIIPTIKQEKDQYGFVTKRDFYYDQKIPYQGQKLLAFAPKIKETVEPPVKGDPNFIPVIETEKTEIDLFKDLIKEPVPKKESIYKIEPVSIQEPALDNPEISPVTEDLFKDQPEPVKTPAQPEQNVEDQSNCSQTCQTCQTQCNTKCKMKKSKCKSRCKPCRKCRR